MSDDKKPIFIEARRWFSKGGNTYHTVRVICSDGSSKVSPLTYGYGEHFYHTAGTLLGLKDPYECVRDLGIESSVTDVGRKKDLHKP